MILDHFEIIFDSDFELYTYAFFVRRVFSLGFVYNNLRLKHRCHICHLAGEEKINYYAKIRTP